VSVNPGSKPGLVDVSIHNHGNIDLVKLPVPPNVKSVYSGPTTTMYVTEAAVPDTAQLCRDLLLKAGWEPHGTAGDTTSYFRQNAIRLTVTVSSAPAQGGKTMISISPELMSAELPAHPDATEVQYADTLRRLSFLTTAENDALFGFYKIELGKAGWKPNREEAIQVDDKDEMVFRNGDGVVFVEAKKSRANNRYVEVSYTTITEMNAAAERMKKKLAADKEKAGTK
jgi:hypothetical protein